MKVTKEKDCIIIEGKDFNIADTLECGQVFSFIKLNDAKYIVTSQDKLAKIKIVDDKTIIETADVDYFYNYFDLTTDYDAIKFKLCQIYPDFTNFLNSGSSIRILKQDKIQTIISFIVSANNNIKRIKKILFALSQKYGREIDNGIYSFPTLAQLSSVTCQDFEKIGMGYRAPYIVDTVKQLLTDEYSVDFLSTLDTTHLKQKLLALKGVGPKVADCILFFGFSRSDVFPVDTWIRKSYNLFCEVSRSDKEIAHYFVSLFGEYSGYAQQYIFNFMINS